MIATVIYSLLCFDPFYRIIRLLMAQCGIARSLKDLANALVGTFKGGLALEYSDLHDFGAIAALHSFVGVGGFMIPTDDRLGYNRQFSTSVLLPLSTGLLIHPAM
jgi:TRAP-type C4-dicarboxylate transport system permease large subunit